MAFYVSDCETITKNNIYYFTSYSNLTSTTQITQ